MTWDLDTDGGVAPYWTVSASAFKANYEPFGISSKKASKHRSREIRSFAMVGHPSFVLCGPFSATCRKSGN